MLPVIFLGNLKSPDKKGSISLQTTQVLYFPTV